MTEAGACQGRRFSLFLTTALLARRHPRDEPKDDEVAVRGPSPQCGFDTASETTIPIENKSS
jgi:hypothetical protein